MLGRKHKTTESALLLTTLLLAPGCMIYYGGCVNWAKYERTIELNQDLPPGSRVEVSTASGSITTRGTDTSNCHVIAKIRARAVTVEEAQAFAEQVTIAMHPTAEGLQIKAERPRNRHRYQLSISYDLTVPQQSHMNCRSASGSLHLENLSGDVRAHAASGSIRCSDIAQGKVDCDTASGNVSLTRALAIGSCNLRTASGSVKAIEVEAKSIHLKTASGGVTADRVTCASLNGHSSSGSVRANFTPATPGNLNADLSTHSGSVCVNLPPDFAGHIDVGTHSGSVHVDRPFTIQGKINKRSIRGEIGTGSGRLHAHTSSGSVTVK